MIRWLIALGVFLAPTVALAQITNVLNTVREHDEDGAAFVLAGALDWRSGNSDKLEVSGATTFIGKTGPHLVLVSANGELALRNDERFIARHLEHGRYRISVVGPLQLEAFVQHDFNEFRRRAIRIVFGAGPRLVLPLPAPLEQAFGLSYMPEYEELSVGAFADSGVTRWHHRVSAYSSTSVRFTDRLRLDFTLYGQPALEEFTNARMFGELGFSIQVMGPLSVNLSWVMQLDTKPPESIRPVDSVRKVGLTLEL